jgi:hypothetical protein
MKGMEQELITPEHQPKSSSQVASPFACFLAAAGATLTTLCLLGAAAAATVWAFSKLLGMPDTVVYVGIALSMLPVLWATVWTAGRAWHVEQRLSRGQDVDTPVFQAGHYLKSSR